MADCRVSRIKTHAHQPLVKHKPSPTALLGITHGEGEAALGFGTIVEDARAAVREMRRWTQAAVRAPGGWPEGLLTLSPLGAALGVPGQEPPGHRHGNQVGAGGALRSLVHFPHCA